MSRRLVLPFLAALAATMLAIPAAGDPWLPAPGEYAIDLQGVHVGSGGHFYNDIGETIHSSVLGEARHIQAINDLGWKSWVSFRLGARFSSVTLRLDPHPLSVVSPDVFSRAGLSDMLVGMRFRLLDRGGLAMALETDWQLPLGYEKDVVPSLGDGLHHFSAELQAGLPIAAFQGFAQGSLGYVTHLDLHMNPMKATHPVGSPTIVFDTDVAGWIGNSVLVAARYAGYSSKAEGAFGLDRNKQSFGPEVRYRIDDRMNVYVGASFDFAGRNALKENVYYLGLATQQTRLHRLQGFLGAGRRP